MTKLEELKAAVDAAWATYAAAYDARDYDASDAAYEAYDAAYDAWADAVAAAYKAELKKSKEQQMADTFFGISRRKFTDDELKLMATAVADAVAQQARIDELEEVQ
tara:strand:+ start:1766 stop:2083 length:318 start_codon:yes stop_codon:yes gene_type:complete